MVGMTEKKKQIREKIKSRSSPFTRLKALKRIRNDRAWGLLSSLAIRLSWWRERREWQGSRPSLGLTTGRSFFPRRLLYLPLLSECQKCSWNISPKRQHNSQCQTLITVADEIEGEGMMGVWEKTHILFTIHLYTLYEARIQGRRSRFVYHNQIEQIRVHIFLEQEDISHPGYLVEHQLTHMSLGFKRYYRIKLFSRAGLKGMLFIRLSPFIFKWRKLYKITTVASNWYTTA